MTLIGSIDEFRRLTRSTGTYAIEPPTGDPAMSTPAHPGRMLFVNLPVADVGRSKAFFAALGFSYNPMFTDETAACMLVGEHAFVMLLSRERFADFAKLPIADPTTHTLALYCFSVSSREEVDAVSAAALAAGGTEADGAEDLGFMYSRSFFDLDGHGWQVMWMDPATPLDKAHRPPVCSRRGSPGGCSARDLRPWCAGPARSSWPAPRTAARRPPC